MEVPVGGAVHEDVTVTTYEPCPFCDGTGQRVVPPPARARGGSGKLNHRGRSHGYESTYKIGCRCELCRAAHREGTARRKRERQHGDSR